MPAFDNVTNPLEVNIPVCFENRVPLGEILAPLFKHISLRQGGQTAFTRVMSARDLHNTVQENIMRSFTLGRPIKQHELESTDLFKDSVLKRKPKKATDSPVADPVITLEKDRTLAQLISHIRQ
jgi:hypothetical protein